MFRSIGKESGESGVILVCTEIIKKLTSCFNKCQYSELSLIVAMNESLQCVDNVG